MTPGGSGFLLFPGNLGIMGEGGKRARGRSSA